MIIPIWFAISVVLFIADKPCIARQLRKNGVQISWSDVQLPGYINKKYKEWCRDVGRDPTARMMVSQLILVNMFFAGAMFVRVMFAELG